MVALNVVIVTVDVGAMSAVPNFGAAMIRALLAGVLPGAGSPVVAAGPAGGAAG